MDDHLRLKTPPPSTPIEVDDFPLRVVPDWDEQLQRAEEVCRLIDRHLEFEARGRILQDPYDFRPQYLCPEQRVSLLSDLYAASH